MYNWSQFVFFFAKYPKLNVGSCCICTPIEFFDLLTPLLVGVALFLAIMATASRDEEGRQNTGAKILFREIYSLMC